MFRFDYSPNFLKWALKPPGWKKEWHLCVRNTAKNSQKLIGFITAIPATIILYGKEHRMVEINFLCVHRNWRTNRLAPVLIKEITRRSNVNGIFQAVYTAGISLPTPVASCQYWHRSLNPKKLIEVGFSQLKPRMTHQRTIKLYALPPETSTPGLRQLTKADCPSACKLLNDYLSKFNIRMHFSNEDFEHWFTPVKEVIETYVVVDPKKKEVTDLISFYSLPSSILKSPKHKKLQAAYSWYNVATTQKLEDLMRDSLVIAKSQDFDVFNCLAIHDNQTFLKELKFGAGDGNLQFYLYNWLAPPMEPNQVGLVLL
jgi:glycylpeptide N-tetradecanoyltransferase